MSHGPIIPIHTPSALDVDNKANLERLMRDVVAEVNRIQSIVASLTGKKLEVTTEVMLQIRSALMRTGAFPLNIDGLLGILAMPQVPGLIITADITTLLAKSYPVNTMAVATGSPADTLYYNKLDASGNHTWTALHAAGPIDMVTTDTVQTIGPGATKTFSDPTHFLDNADIVKSVNAAIDIAITNANVGNAAAAGMLATNNLSSVGLFAIGGGVATARYGIALGGYAELTAFAGLLGLILGTQDAVPVVFGTHNLEALRIDGNQQIIQKLGSNGATATLGWATELVTLSTVGATTDSSANLLSSNALIRAVLLYVQTTITGAGVASVDVGDATIANRFGQISTLTSPAAVVGLNHMQGSVAADNKGPVQFSAAKLRFTANGGIPTAGKVRAVVLYEAFVAPTS